MKRICKLKFKLKIKIVKIKLEMLIKKCILIKIQVLQHIVYDLIKIILMIMT